MSSTRQLSPIKFGLSLVVLAVLTWSVPAQTTNDPFRVVWGAPFDSPFVADTVVDITITVYGQNDSLLPGLVLDLELKGITRQDMTDNGDGTYTLAGVDLTPELGNTLEAVLKVPVGNNNAKEVQFFFLGSSPGQGQDVWKLDFLSPASGVHNAADSIVFTVQLFNDTGGLWPGETVEIEVNEIQRGIRVVNPVVMQDNGDGTYSYTLPGGTLNSGTEFEVIVSTPNTNNNAEAFRVLEIILGPTPELIDVSSPTNNPRPTFQWHPLAGATVYTIEIDTDNRFGNPIIITQTADTSFTPLIDLPVGTIFWRVSGDNNPNVFSPTSSFDFADPNIPILIAYMPDPTQEKKPTLQWHSIAGAATYTIVIDDNRDFSSPIISTPLADTFFTPLIGLPVGTIFWRVKSDLNASFSISDDFEILSQDIPLLVSFNGDTVSLPRPIFAWSAVPNATTYRIEIATDPGFNNILVTTPLADTNFTPLFDLAPNTYYWRVSTDLDFGAFSPGDSLVIELPTSALPKNVKQKQLSNLSFYPNPFVSSTTIQFNLPGQVELFVYDVQGHLIKTLISNRWNGTDQLNRAIPAGQYFVRAKYRGGALTAPVRVIR